MNRSNCQERRQEVLDRSAHAEGHYDVDEEQDERLAERFLKEEHDADEPDEQREHDADEERDEGDNGRNYHDRVATSQRSTGAEFLERARLDVLDEEKRDRQNAGLDG